MTDFAYRSAAHFLKAPDATATHRYAVAGIAWDGAVTNRPGARFGPRAIRQASHMLCDGIHPLFDVSPLTGPGGASCLGDLGDLPLPNTSLERLRTALETQAADLLPRHHMLWLGGDHAVTLSLLRAYRRWLGRPLAVLHFDAHCDTWGDHFGEPSGHGTWVREAFEEGLVEPALFTQVGIRSAGERTAREYVTDHGGRIHTARALRGLDGTALAARVIDDLTTRWSAAGRPPLYMSLDIDCLDPAFAPGTGTPEPGGLHSTQLLTLLEAAAPLPWVGMDCVEVAPPYDHAEITSLAAATLVWTYLCGRIHHDGPSQAPALSAAHHSG
ncbi:MAG: agmatinase [Burkholderiaceae bacterium]|nr:agmatinase [Burkholderiaceae bacterium]